MTCIRTRPFANEKKKIQELIIIQCNVIEHIPIFRMLLEF